MQSKEQLVVPAICGLSAHELSIVAPRALEHLPKMLSAAKTSKDSKVSSNSLKLFSMLAASYPGAEQVLLEQLVNTDASDNAVVIVNTLAMLIVQKAQIDLVLTVMKTIETHQFAMRLIPLFCTSIASLAQFSSTTLLQALLRAASLLRDERARTEIEWQMTKLCVQWPQPQLPLVLRGIIADRHMVLHGELISLGGQYPMRGFEVSRWNSIESGPRSSPGAQDEKTVYVNRHTAIVSISRKASCEVTCRTVVGRHVWELDTHEENKKTSTNVTNWLRKEAVKGKKPGRESQGILGAMDDPFDELPEARAQSAGSSYSDASPIEGSGQFSSIIETSRRQPQPIGSYSQHSVPAFTPNSKLLEWRSLSASLGFVPAVSSVHSNFQRDLKHLDQTSSREVHKVAVIYVAEGQEDRSSILSNISASPQFDEFACELGWEVKIGRGHDGYTGGLPVETRAPYYADAESEVIFHVSTMLNGDVQQKWKHIGNDEVHVIWTENNRKVYTRETIATKFCDVLIVLEHVGDRVSDVHPKMTISWFFRWFGSVSTQHQLSSSVPCSMVHSYRWLNLHNLSDSQ